MVITMNVRISELNRYKAFGLFVVASLLLFLALNFLVGAIYIVLRDTDLINQFVLAIQLYWGFVKSFLLLLAIFTGWLFYFYRKNKLNEVALGAIAVSVLSGILFLFSLFI